MFYTEIPTCKAQRSARQFSKRGERGQYWAWSVASPCLFTLPKSTFYNFWQHNIFIKSSEISPVNFCLNNQTSIIVLLPKIVLHFHAFSNFRSQFFRCFLCQRPFQARYSFFTLFFLIFDQVLRSVETSVEIKDD